MRSVKLFSLILNHTIFSRLAFIAFVASGACALTISAGANQPPALAPAKAPFQVISMEAPSEDMRLAKSCVLQCEGETLGEVLQKLQQQSGVSLQTETPWISNLTLYAFTRPMPLHTILQRLASLHTLTWRQNVILPDTAKTETMAPPPTYTLFQSFRNREYVARLKQQSWEPLRRHIAQFRIYAAFPPHKLKTLAENGDQLAQHMLDPRAKADVVLLSLVPDEALEELIKKRSKTLTYTQLPPPGQEALAILARLDDKNRGNVSNQPVAPEVDSSANNSAPSYSVRYFVYGEGGNANLRTMISAPHETYTGQAPAYSGGAEKPWIEAKFREGRLSVAAANRAETRKVPHDALFGKLAWQDTLKAMSTTWNLNVFSDAYPFDPQQDTLGSAFPQSFTAQMPLRNGLNAGSLWQRVWWQEGVKGTDILFLRPEWYEWRDEGITDSLIVRLKALQKQNVPFSLEDWADILTLPDVMASRLTAELKINIILMRAKRDLLAFYRGLRPADKRKLFTQGLSYADLNNTTREEFVQALHSVNAPSDDEALSTMRLHLSVDDRSSRFYLETEPAQPTALPKMEWRVPGVPQASASEKKAAPKRIAGDSGL